MTYLDDLAAQVRAGVEFDTRQAAALDSLMAHVVDVRDTLAAISESAIATDDGQKLAREALKRLGG